MPNPRLSFRIPQNILDLLPTDADERSQFCLEAIYEKLNPPAPEGELGDLKQRLEALEQAIVALLEKAEQPRRTRREPSDIDQAIKDALMRIRPSERRQAQKLFNQLRT